MDTEYILQIENGILTIPEDAVTLLGKEPVITRTPDNGCILYSINDFEALSDAMNTFERLISWKTRELARLILGNAVRLNIEPGNRIKLPVSYEHLYGSQVMLKRTERGILLIPE